MEGKSALQSQTYHGLGIVQTMILGLVVNFVAHKFGVTNSGDVATIKSSVTDILSLVFAIIGQAGVIYAAIGRNKATQPITGVLKAAPVATPTIAESGGPQPDDPPY